MRYIAWGMGMTVVVIVLFLEIAYALDGVPPAGRYRIKDSGGDTIGFLDSDGAGGYTLLEVDGNGSAGAVIETGVLDRQGSTNIWDMKTPGDRGDLWTTEGTGIYWVENNSIGRGRLWPE